ncbi:hypothetical protein BJV77DRAFT_637007 [Russula vinacea]|nr:hypothetical protein BJV77DRAFT_637007 [Russula vinacea]
MQRGFRDQGLRDQYPIDQFSGRPWLRRGSIIVLQLSQFCLSHTHPGAVSKRHPTYEPLMSRTWFVTMGCGLLGALGIGLEVIWVISRDNGGFYVPHKNVFSFASIQFLTSFIPSLLFVPLAMMFRAFDGSIRMWNPYLLLSRGHASADETLLLDYVGDSRPYILYNSLKYKHRFVIISGVTALASLLFQPLAGAIFSVKQLPRSSAASIQSIRAIGLSPDVDDLTSFSASAVFVEAAVSNNIGDSSFVHNGWSIAEFEFPTNVYLNGTIGINTTGIKITTNCALPSRLSVNSSYDNPSRHFEQSSGDDDPVKHLLVNISATSVEGCYWCIDDLSTFTNGKFNDTIYAEDNNDAEQSYGVTTVPGCGTNTSNPAFQTVFFWFLDLSSNSAAAVFCQPSMQLFDVTAFAFLNNNSLTNVTIIGNYTKANNVSGPPLNGVPHNGLIFNFPDGLQRNAMTRATSIATGIPSAIFRQAEQAPGGLHPLSRTGTSFWSIPNRLYPVPRPRGKIELLYTTERTANAVLTQLVSRLYVESVAAHILASICIGVACVVLVLHYMHFRERRDIHLAHCPGSIGSALALTAHSGFGELLLPYDNAEEFSRALASFRFCLDRRTGDRCG